MSDDFETVRIQLLQTVAPEPGQRGPSLAALDRIEARLREAWELARWEHERALEQATDAGKYERRIAELEQAVAGLMEARRQSFDENVDTKAALIRARQEVDRLIARCAALDEQVIEARQDKAMLQGIVDQLRREVGAALE